MTVNRAMTMFKEQSLPLEEEACKHHHAPSQERSHTQDLLAGIEQRQMKKEKGMSHLEGLPPKLGMFLKYCNKLLLSDAVRGQRRQLAPMGAMIR